MKSQKNFGVVASLIVCLLMAIFACAETSSAPSTPIPPATAAPAPTPTDEERKMKTPTDFGTNTRIVAGDIHVWHEPTCQPVPPATFVSSIIMTDLRSGSHLYLNRDGSVRDSPAPDYRSDEGRKRFTEVLEDSSLMEQILAPVECP